jgi:dipeptidyl aminopeptidase/acylaminoacyl peptidase
MLKILNNSCISALFLLLTFIIQAGAAGSSSKASIQTKSPNRLVCEGYENSNWELFILDADGSNLTNLTKTPDIHELYPKVSPDGKMIAFVSDKGKGRKTVRSVWIMNIDGTNRIKAADYARQPFWAPDSKTLGWLPQEYKKFNVSDFSTKGMMFYNLKTKESHPHSNAENLFHLYSPGFSPDGKWIASTVHAGMGFNHADILIEADGSRVIDLKVHGCRPCFSPDGKHLAWGASDHKIEIAEINWSGRLPALDRESCAIIDDKNKIYHVDWAPDGKTVAISRGPAGKGDPGKPGTHQAASEVVGVYAADWNLLTVNVEDGGTIDLNAQPDGKWKQITHNGQSYKEADWIPANK